MNHTELIMHLCHLCDVILDGSHSRCRDVRLCVRLHLCVMSIVFHRACAVINQIIILTIPSTEASVETAWAFVVFANFDQFEIIE